MTIQASNEQSDVENLEMYVSMEGDRHFVHASGVLTASTRNVLFRCCLASGQLHVIVDMTHVTRIDRDGYAAVLAARRVLDAEGGSLVLRHVGSSAARFVLVTDNHGG
jgi:anti-anti-sigma regulatory factor